MTYIIRFRKSAAEFLYSLPEKSQRIILNTIAGLKRDPFPNKTGKIEKLSTREMEVFRIHISRSFTAIYLIHVDVQMVEITHLMTIEQAHKRYGRL